MSSLASITVVGYVGKDPVTRQAGQSTVTEFSVATEIKSKEESTTTWWKVVTWGRKAEICGQYVRKGMQVAVSGTVGQKSYTKDEAIKTYMEINANEVSFLGSPKEQTASSDKPRATSPPPARPTDDEPPF